MTEKILFETDSYLYECLCLSSMLVDFSQWNHKEYLEELKDKTRQ